MSAGGRTKLSHPWHLAKRFATSLSTRPPTAAAEAWARSQLLAGEQAVWAGMSSQDRRHAVTVAHRFVEGAPDASRPAIAAALLHDCGKTPSHLGTFGRTLATVIGPHGSRFRRYHDHERIGAELAGQAGSDPLTVQLIVRAREAPASLLAALAAADDI